MTYRIALAALKFAAIIVTGLLGVLSLRVEYKDENGEVTKWGRRALLATVSATIIGAIIIAVETYQQRRDADEQTTKTLAILNEVRRGVYPLRDVVVNADVVIPLNVPQDAYAENVFLRSYLSGYSDRLKSIGQRATHVPDALADQARQYNANLVFYKTQPAYVFGSKAALYPTADEVFPRQMFDNLELILRFYSKEHSSLSYTNHHESEPDLAYVARSTAATAYVYRFDEDSSVTVQLRDLPVTVLRSSDTLISSVDLSDAMLEVSVSDSDPDRGVDEVIRRFLKRAKIKWLGIEIDGRPFTIRGNRFRQKGSTGLVYYVLPSDFTGRASNEAP